MNSDSAWNTTNRAHYGLRNRNLGEVRERDTLPGRVELRPSSHAVNIERHGRPRQGAHLRPLQRERRLDLSPHAEVPAREVRIFGVRTDFGQDLPGAGAARALGQRRNNRHARHVGEPESVGRAIANVFEKHGVKATPLIVNIDNEGRTIAA